MANTFVPIQSITLTDNTTTTVTFSSIPQTYTDLVVRYTARSTAGYLAPMRVYGTQTNNKGQTWLKGYNSTATSANYAGSYNFFVGDNLLTGVLNTANTFGTGEIYIPNYRATAAKQISWFGVSEGNSTQYAVITATAGYDPDTAAYTSFALVDWSGSPFAAGSTFHLYGIKNA